ncbi:hypothetical protein FHT36_000396 [Xanthobacter sp. SG618]|nr:hypothetical protein [Xanthobacter sp. SG618]
MTGEGIHRCRFVVMLRAYSSPEGSPARPAARRVKANMPNLSSRLQTRLMTGVEHKQ